MKGKQSPIHKNKGVKYAHSDIQPLSDTSASLAKRLDQWLETHRRAVLGALILFWVIIRILMFNSVANGPLYNMYRWPDSDNFFYDDWARKIAGGDWLNRESIHPYHKWHKEFAEYYFKQHPEKLNEILTANPNADSSFAPGKVLWNKWYGGNTYHQEPLYTYVLAVLYTLTGNGVYWMLLLQALIGVGSGILLWFITRKYFGDTVALVTGILYLFCGIVLFQEALLLRTSWTVFFVLATIWVFDKALEKRTTAAFFQCGLVIGLAFLIQSTFILFLLGALSIYGWHERKRPSKLTRNIGILSLGFFLVFAPVIVRNAMVGAPVFSISSVGASTFVASNVHGSKTIQTWMPEASKCAEIMGKTKGSFGPVVVEALSTHSSVSSYLNQVWSKFLHTINGREWPNNENYYFYKQLVPALNLAFLNFYWIVWLGVAGLLFSAYQRKKRGALYLAIVVQMSILLGFYVLGRFRCPLVVLLLPFAAYALVECLRVSQQPIKESIAKIAVAGVCFFALSYSFYQPGITGLDATDYNVFYELNYYERVKKQAESGQYDQAIAAHAEFLGIQPDLVRNASPQLRYTSMDADILYLFANHYQIHSYLYEDSGNKSMAASMMARYTRLKLLADAARKNHR